MSKYTAFSNWTHVVVSKTACSFDCCVLVCLVSIMTGKLRNRFEQSLVSLQESAREGSDADLDFSLVRRLHRNFPRHFVEGGAIRRGVYGCALLHTVPADFFTHFYNQIYFVIVFLHAFLC